MGVSYYPERSGAIKSIQEVNATFTTTNSGVDTIYEVSLSVAVSKDKSIFIPTGHANADIMRANGGNNGVTNQGIIIKDGGTALQIYVWDTYAGTIRVTGTVVEYW